MVEKGRKQMSHAPGLWQVRCARVTLRECSDGIFLSSSSSSSASSSCLLDHFPNCSTWGGAQEGSNRLQHELLLAVIKEKVFGSYLGNEIETSSAAAAARHCIRRKSSEWCSVFCLLRYFLCYC